MGTLCAAVIAGLFLRRNLWKTPYDRLELLSKARADWPEEDPEGLASLNRSIAFALEQIRRNEGGKAHPATTLVMREAVAQALRVDRRNAILIFAASPLVSAALCGSLYAAVGPTTELAPLIGAGVLMWLGAGGVLLRYYGVEILFGIDPDRR
ncbi:MULTISPECIES: hypothetical protein [Nocardia]|uniref:hypothetical protein n=1 Tax=Nocardia TaxID=1817 RepID=UPI000D698957|nr:MULTISPECIES: hypothetical protein [Nocardia]